MFRPFIRLWNKLSGSGRSRRGNRSSETSDRTTRFHGRYRSKGSLLVRVSHEASTVGLRVTIAYKRPPRLSSRLTRDLADSQQAVVTSSMTAHFHYLAVAYGRELSSSEDTRMNFSRESREFRDRIEVFTLTSGWGRNDRHALWNRIRNQLSLLSPQMRNEVDRSYTRHVDRGDGQLIPVYVTGYDRFRLEEGDYEVSEWRYSLTLDTGPMHNVEDTEEVADSRSRRWERALQGACRMDPALRAYFPEVA